MRNVSRAIEACCQDCRENDARLFARGGGMFPQVGDVYGNPRRLFWLVTHSHPDHSGVEYYVPLSCDPVEFSVRIPGTKYFAVLGEGRWLQYDEFESYREGGAPVLDWRTEWSEFVRRELAKWVRGGKTSKTLHGLRLEDEI